MINQYWPFLKASNLANFYVLNATMTINVHKRPCPHFPWTNGRLWTNGRVHGRGRPLVPYGSSSSGNFQAKKRHHSKQHDKGKKKDIYDESYTQKLLLLGTGQSGKSTIMKQLKILHEKDFLFNERMQIRIDIKQNVCESIVHIIEKAKEMGYFGEDTEPELQNT